jgi:hypothetical protein
LPRKKTRADFIAWFNELYARSQVELKDLREERLVIQCLLYHAIATWNASYQVPASRKWLAAQTGLTVDQARGALKTLIDWGWLAKIDDPELIRYRQLRMYIKRFPSYKAPVVVEFRNPPVYEETIAREEMLGLGDEPEEPL